MTLGYGTVQEVTVGLSILQARLCCLRFFFFFVAVWLAKGKLVLCKIVPVPYLQFYR